MPLHLVPAFLLSTAIGLSLGLRRAFALFVLCVGAAIAVQALLSLR